MLIWKYMYYYETNISSFSINASDEYFQFQNFSADFMPLGFGLLFFVDSREYVRVENTFRGSPLNKNMFFFHAASVLVSDNVI